MDIIVDKGCGLDVHKGTVVACIMGTGIRKEVKTYYYYVMVKIKNQYFQLLSSFNEIERHLKKQYRALNKGLMIILKSIKRSSTIRP